MKLKLMTAQYPGGCKRCKQRFGSGDSIYWSKGTGAICRKCGDEGKPDDGPDMGKPQIPTPEIPFNLPPAPPKVKGKPHDFVIDWVDLKGIVQSAIAGKKPLKGKQNADVIRRHILEPDQSWNGYTVGQIERWLREGFHAEAIQGLSEFTPMIREKRRLKYTDEGDEFHADLAMAGEENFMSTWTKREIIPGLSLDCIVTFAATTPAEVVNAYNVWICRTVYSLESAGVDCEVTLNYTSDNQIAGIPGRTNTRVRVKKENEVTDFASISPMLSPAAFRGFLFTAIAAHAESRGLEAAHGLGVGPDEMKWDCYYDAESKKIVVKSTRIGAREFPAEEMTRKFREALKAAMKG